MAITNYNRAYSITITFKEGYGDEITIDSPKAEPIYSDFRAYVKGSRNAARGFELIEQDGSACLYLFEAIAKICKTATTATESEDGKCQDIDICDLLNENTGD